FDLDNKKADITSWMARRWLDRFSLLIEFVDDQKLPFNILFSRAAPIMAIIILISFAISSNSHCIWADI
ncbi:MAG: hypothetical protein LUQ22_04665, partial [Methanotrichaceae archaeon]|nr:hypothetical protein [Methanotrichaceae archaeon]